MGNVENVFAYSYISAGPGGETRYSSGAAVGNHAKFFSVDDRAFYVGSNNLYVCNLAEFGVVVDDQAATQDLLKYYFKPTLDQSKKISVESVKLGAVLRNETYPNLDDGSYCDACCPGALSCCR